MMDYESTKAFFEGLIVPLALAAFGGVARACRFGFKGWKQFCGSIVASGFSGVVVHLMINDVGLSLSVQAAIVATSGYSGGAIIDGLVAGLTKRAERIGNGD